MKDLGLFYIERKFRLANLKKKSKSELYERMCNILEDEAQEQLIDKIEAPWKEQNKSIDNKK